MTPLSYDEARAVIQTGDVIFFYGKWSNPLQALIMAVTQSRFVHCAIAVWVTIEGEQRLMCVEAQGGNHRRIVNFSFYDDRQVVVLAAPTAWSGIKSKVLERVGKVSYGWFTAMYVGLRELLLRELNIKLPIFSLPSEICSQFCAKVYDITPSEISPSALYDAMRQITTVRK